MYSRTKNLSYVDNRALVTRAHQGPLLKILRANGAPYRCSVEYHGAVSWNALPLGRRNARDKRNFQKGK